MVRTVCKLPELIYEWRDILTEPKWPTVKAAAKPGQDSIS